MFHVDGVSVSKLNDRIAKQTHPGLYIGFADFNLVAHRFPRGELFEPVANRAPATMGPPLAPYGLILGPELPLPPHSLALTE